MNFARALCQVRTQYARYLIAEWDQEAVHAEGLAADAQLSKDYCLLCIKACDASP